MGKIYDRECDYCGKSYRGRGRKFCSKYCFKKDQQNRGAEQDILNVDKKGRISKSQTYRNRIVTVEDLKAAVDFDEDVFRLIRGSHNKWEVGAKHPKTGEILVEPLFQVKLQWEPVEELVESRAVLREYIRQAREHSPTDYEEVLERRPDDGVDDTYVYEVNITDHHVGSLVYGLETRSANRDTSIAVDEFLWGVEQLVREVEGRHIERFLFPLGNDLFHADRLAGDGSGGVTTRGTIVDVDTRRKKLIRTVQKMCITAIDYMRTIAPVDVVIVPGNHDEDTTFTLGEYLTAWYRNVANVDIDNRETMRKYYEYGEVMLGFTHGKHETLKRLPMQMPLDEPEMWARTSFRELHIGDKHKLNKRDIISADEELGIRVRIFPSLAGQDAWHAKKGYASHRAAEAYLWGAETGFRGMFSANLKRK